jgi:hypothetical protein
MNSLVYLKTPFQNIWTPLSRFRDASNVFDGDLDSLSTKSFDISNESLKEAKRLFIDGSPRLISKYIAKSLRHWTDIAGPPPSKQSISRGETGHFPGWI